MGRSPDISMEADFLPVRMEFWHDLMARVSVPREELFPQISTTHDNDDDKPQPKNATVQVNSTETIVFSFYTIIIFLSFHFIF